MEEVLVIQAARFGDILQTKRLILSLCQNYKVHLAVDDSLTELAKLVYPGITVHSVLFHKKASMENLPELMANFSVLKEFDFKYIFNCNYSCLSTCLSRLFPEDKIIGPHLANKSAGGIICPPWSRLVFKISKTRKYSSLNLVDFWAWFAKDPLNADMVNPPAKAGGEGLGIVIAGRESRRSLPVHILAEIITVIVKILSPSKIKLLGTKNEFPFAKRLTHLLPTSFQDKIDNLCGKTDWPALYEEMSGLDLLLSPDTGSMHLAAHLGVPVMAFFLSSAFCHETAPYGEGHYIWQAMQNCSPCLESAPCPNKVKCLEVFASQEFARFISALLLNRQHILLKLPSSVQLWKTGYDELGQKLLLKAGSDTFAPQRDFIRMLLFSFLHLHNEYSAELPAEDKAFIARELFPPEEWMLPPERFY